MSKNKATVQAYIDGFNKSDHQQILDCLADDIEWVMPGAFSLNGKSAFDKEIENDAFVGSPSIKLKSLTEESDVVVAEGSVTCMRKDGSLLNAVFCDVFRMCESKIRHLTTYQVELKP